MKKTYLNLSIGTFILALGLVYAASVEIGKGAPNGSDKLFFAEVMGTMLLFSYSCLFITLREIIIAKEQRKPEMVKLQKTFGRDMLLSAFLCKIILVATAIFS